MGFLDRLLGTRIIVWGESNILLPPKDLKEAAELKRLQALVDARRFVSPLGVEVKVHNRPIDMNADFFPPAHRLLEVQKETGRRIIGLADWFAEKDGHRTEDYAVPLFEASKKDGN